jgi:hypothetical protein
MKRDPTSRYLTEAFHDVPDHALEFVARASAHAWALQLPVRARGADQQPTRSRAVAAELGVKVVQPGDTDALDEYGAQATD